MQDPQSLHKYAYVHGEPIGSIDPSGLMSLGNTMSSMGARMQMAGTTTLNILRSRRQAALALTVVQNIAVSTLGVSNVLSAGVFNYDGIVINLGWGGGYLGWALGGAVTIYVQQGKVYAGLSVETGIAPVSTLNNHAWSIGAGAGNLTFTFGFAYNAPKPSDLGGVSMVATIPEAIIRPHFVGLLTGNNHMQQLAKIGNLAAGNWLNRMMGVVSVGTNMRTTAVTFGWRGFGWSATASRTFGMVEIVDLNDLFLLMANGAAGNQQMPPPSPFPDWMVDMWDTIVGINGRQR